MLCSNHSIFKDICLIFCSTFYACDLNKFPGKICQSELVMALGPKRRSRLGNQRTNSNFSFNSTVVVGELGGEKEEKEEWHTIAECNWFVSFGFVFVDQESKAMQGNLIDKSWSSRWMGEVDLEWSKYWVKGGWVWMRWIQGIWSGIQRKNSSNHCGLFNFPNSKVDTTALTAKFTSKPWIFCQALTIVKMQSYNFELWEPSFDWWQWTKLYIHWLMSSKPIYTNSYVSQTVF